jgi:CubicO group peptidase (beta-lactamase class C family)
MKLLFFLFSAIVSFPSFCQEKDPSIYNKKLVDLDKVINRLMKEWNVPGLAIAVVEKDSVIYTKGYGYSNYGSKIRVTPHTKFLIGSCTKPFTASLIGLLHQEGKLDMDKPVRNYLKQLQFNTDELNNGVTPRDMMSHRSGLPRSDISTFLFPYSSSKELVERIGYMEPTASIRQRFQYNNEMYVMLGLLQEEVTGKPWDEYIKEKLLDPLEMQETTTNFLDGTEKRGDIALGYSFSRDNTERIKLPDYKVLAPTGAIGSNVLELANWLKMWINGGKYKGKQILPLSYINNALMGHSFKGSSLPQVKDRPDLTFNSYGLGWSIWSQGGHYIASHVGIIDGYSAEMAFLPTDSVGFVLLTNKDFTPINQILRSIIIDRLVNAKDYDWNQYYEKQWQKADFTGEMGQKAFAEKRKTNAPASHQPMQYTGSYTHPGYGIIEVSLKSNTLYAAVGGRLLRLEHYHYNYYQPYLDKESSKGFPWLLPKFQFLVGESGEIEGISTALELDERKVLFTKQKTAKKKQ